MATPRLCSIPDCGKVHFGRGFCAKHYKLKFRTPLTRRKDPSRELPREWIARHLDHSDASSCLVWPFRRDKCGYGVASYQRRSLSASRLMCIKAHGDPPTPRHQAAHSCGKGHEGCVNPLHLRWATPLENNVDKLVHGTAGSSAWLSDDDVRCIRQMRGILSQTILADRYGVHKATISKVQTGVRRSHVE